MTSLSGEQMAGLERRPNESDIRTSGRLLCATYSVIMPKTGGRKAANLASDIYFHAVKVKQA